MKIEKYQQASEIWLEFRDGLKGYIIKKTKNSELAEEINQQVLMKVINSCCSDVQIKNVRSWLFQIAHNTTIDNLKKQKKYVELEKEIEEQPNEKTYSEIEPFVISLIGFLPEKYALPLKMSDIEGQKQQDVADKLGLSLTATKSRIQRARELLKKEILTCFHIDDEKMKRGLNDIKLKDSCEPLKDVLKKK